MSVRVIISVNGGGKCWAERLNVFSGKRKESDLMKLDKNCIHVVCKDISSLHISFKINEAKQ